MKAIYITKFALSKGILEVQTDDADHLYSCFPKHCFMSYDEAKGQALHMREDAIQKHKDKITALEDLSF